ncbi:hypothetical protein ACWLO4_002570 [Vibrio vulnificus]
MSKDIVIAIDKLKEIIESDWDDDIIRMKIGEYALSVAEKSDSDVKDLLDIKFIKRTTPELLQQASARCCRGRV